MRTQASWWVASSLFSAIALLATHAANAAQSGTEWVRSADGSYAFGTSGIVCPAAIAPFTFQTSNAADGANVMASCSYADEDTGAGEIRIRPIPPGVDLASLSSSDLVKAYLDPQLIALPTLSRPNDDPASAACGVMKDKNKFHPSVAATVVFCEGAGPKISGAATIRELVVAAYRGYLVDCMAWEKESVIGGRNRSGTFAGYCLHLLLKDAAKAQ